MQRPYGERDEGRVNSRNGYRGRELSTRAALTSPSRFSCAEARSPRPDRALLQVDRALVAVAEMYVMGYRRKVSRRGRLGVRSMSKSQVSRLCECLDTEVDAFRRQRFDGVRFAYLWLDATYVKCRAEAWRDRRDRDRARRPGPQALRRRGLRGHGSRRWKAFLSGRARDGVDGVRPPRRPDAHEGLARR